MQNDPYVVVIWIKKHWMWLIFSHMFAQGKGFCDGDTGDQDLVIKPEGSGCCVTPLQLRGIMSAVQELKSWIVPSQNRLREFLVLSVPLRAINRDTNCGIFLVKICFWTSLWYKTILLWNECLVKYGVKPHGHPQDTQWNKCYCK